MKGGVLGWFDQGFIEHILCKVIFLDKVILL